MTVCIASICKGAILGASDRMLTAGDIKFEPNRPKIHKITNSIVIMTAGDAGFSAEIIQEVIRSVGESARVEPSVKGVTEMFAKHRNLLKMKRAENHILIPLGLDKESFISKQGSMTDQFVNNVANSLVDYQVPGTYVIVSGYDASGPHIYTVYGDIVSCLDSVGFATIGGGERHASSQMMMGGHSPSAALPQTLLLTHFAKKRSEVAPGVGEHTDMFMIAPELGYVALQDHVIGTLDRFYAETKQKEKDIATQANATIKSFFDDIATSQVKPSESQDTTPADLPPEE